MGPCRDPSREPEQWVLGKGRRPVPCPDWVQDPCFGFSAACTSKNKERAAAGTAAGWQGKNGWMVCGFILSSVSFAATGSRLVSVSEVGRNGIGVGLLVGPVP